MQYDTETAWKLFGKVLKKLAADLKGPWACVKMLGGVSIFLFLPIFLNSNLNLATKINSKFSLSNQPCRPPMLTTDSKDSYSDDSSQQIPSPDVPGQVQYGPDEETELLTMEVLEKHEVNFKKCKTILVVKK